MPFNTITVALSTTPTVLSTLIAHIGHRRSAYGLSYAEGVALIRRFLEHASHHTIEQLQSFTAMRVPSPIWVHTEEAAIPTRCLDASAAHIATALGWRESADDAWWRWRERALRAEWVWVQPKPWRHATGAAAAPAADDEAERLACSRTILYVHGGAYFFGSVDEHRYQLQRHARKLRARVFAPRYRLAPQFPFPCALYDVLACYLFLLETREPGDVLFGGDSASVSRPGSEDEHVADEDTGRRPPLKKRKSSGAGSVKGPANKRVDDSVFDGPDCIVLD